MVRGISLYFAANRINIHKQTIYDLGKPEYIHLLINEKEKQMFIQSRERDLDAFRLYYAPESGDKSGRFYVNAKSLLTYLASVINVDRNGPSLRFAGILLEDGATVYINLKEYEVIENEDVVGEES